MTHPPDIMEKARELAGKAFTHAHECSYASDIRYFENRSKFENAVTDLIAAALAEACSVPMSGMAAAQASRLQCRVDACLERHGGNVQEAITGSGIGISYLFAKGLVNALLATRAVPQWLPIKGVPKDGIILVTNGNGTWPCRYMSGPYGEGFYEMGKEHCSPVGSPTHWQPLPAAPNPPIAGGGK